MPKVSISEAARRLDTTEEVIREWIRLGLLDVEPPPAKPRRTRELNLAFQPTSATPEPKVDLEQLYEVADQRSGGFCLSMEAWDRADAETACRLSHTGTIPPL
jgi:transposase-like protein